jgi:hypothetical protein
LVSFNVVDRPGRRWLVKVRSLGFIVIAYERTILAELINTAGLIADLDHSVHSVSPSKPTLTDKAHTAIDAAA